MSNPTIESKRLLDPSTGEPAEPRALLIRVAADQSPGGGSWNSPVDGLTDDFIYVAIPENCLVHPSLEKPYSALQPDLSRIGVDLPAHLRDQRMHLDPDFAHLTYGDAGERAKQIRTYLRPGDVVVFYSGLADFRVRSRLIYAITGLFVVEYLMDARDVLEEDRDFNAHSRRVLDAEARDVIVVGRPGASGRLRHCIPIGEFRDRAYRLRPDLVDAWGGLSVKDGYLQRSARLPRLLNPRCFLEWFEAQSPVLLARNN